MMKPRKLISLAMMLAWTASFSAVRAAEKQ